MIGLVVSLAILVGMGFWLKSIIAATIATRTYNRAKENFEDGDYRTSMRDFDAFLAANPEDARAGKARVLRAFANVRQYVSPDGGTWSSALEAATEMVERVGAEEEFRDERMDLAALIIQIGEALAVRARASADPKALAEAENAVRLHAQVAGEPAPTLLSRSTTACQTERGSCRGHQGADAIRHSGYDGSSPRIIETGGNERGFRGARFPWGIRDHEIGRCRGFSGNDSIHDARRVQG